MSPIRIDLNEVERLSGQLRQLEQQLSGMDSDVSSMARRVEGPIRAHRSIGRRLEGAIYHLSELQNRLRKLRNFVQASGDAYRETEQELVRQADRIGVKEQLQGLESVWRDTAGNPRARPSPEAIRAGYARMGQAAGSAVDWFVRHAELHETNLANMVICVPTSGSGRAQTTDPASPNPFVKSLHSFQEIGEDLLHSAQERSEKALDSPYDFVNYWTLGLSGGWYQGAKLRTEKRWDSAFDFTNWLTSGVAGTIKGAVAPEDPFSKEHWLDSIGAALLLVNGMKVWSEKPDVPVRDGTTHKADHEVKAEALEGAGKADLPPVAGKGQSKGGHQPNNLKEQLSVEESMTNPAAGRTLEGKNTDPRWPASEGWEKKAQSVNGVEVHYQYNPRTGEIDDFKIK